MSENRISSDNAKATAATLEPSNNGKHPVNRLAEPSPNGSVAAAASGGKSPPSPNGAVAYISNVREDEPGPSTNGTKGTAAHVGNVRHDQAASIGTPSINGDFTVPPQAAAATGRAANGQFAIGNRRGPGNPFARQTAALRIELLDTVTPEVMNRVVNKLVERSLEGIVPAIKLLLSYTIGKPAPAPAPDELEEHEWERFTKQATMFGQMPGASFART